MGAIAMTLVIILTLGTAAYLVGDEGHYDKQDEAIIGCRELARKNMVSLFIHGKDGKVREEISKQWT
jgi:Uncharacterized protein conserved in bacteria (DUF2188)